MDLALLFKALILGVVEGLTEFLPVSSTGHLILASDLLDFNDEKGKVFEIVIQTGAMLAIVWEYRAKFAGVIAGLARDRQARQFVVNLVIAFMPAAALGLVFGNYIKAALFKPVPVAIAFIVGGFVILWAERREHRIAVQSVDDMRWTDALKVGCAQAFALIPGTSRSGATIIGGLLFGLFLSAITPHLYRLDVGGHPPVGFPPTGIIIFVFTMMATIVSTFLGVLWEMNFPRFGPTPYHRLVTDGHLAVLLEYPAVLEAKVRQVFESHDAHYVGEPERLAL